MGTNERIDPSMILHMKNSKNIGTKGPSVMGVAFSATSLQKLAVNEPSPNSETATFVYTKKGII